MPLDILPYWDRPHLDRYIKPQPGRDAFVELHNLIVAAESPSDYGPEDLLRISRQHGTDLRTHFRALRRDMYAKYFDHFLKDGALEPDDRALLGHLARSLWLKPEDLAQLHRKAFGRVVARVLQDDCLDVEEQLLLYTMQHTLGLDPDEAAAAYERAARERLLRAIAQALCDGLLSQSQQAEINRLKAELRVEVPPRVAAMMDVAARRWELANGRLPVERVALPVSPHYGERVHLVVPKGAWRTVSGSLKPQSPTSLFWNDESEAEFVRRLATPLRTRHGARGTGKVYVTNRRVILEAAAATSRIDLSRARAARQYDDAVLLKRRGTVHWILHLPEGQASLFTVVVNRILAGP